MDDVKGCGVLEDLLQLQKVISDSVLASGIQPERTIYTAQLNGL